MLRARGKPKTEILSSTYVQFVKPAKQSESGPKPAGNKGKEARNEMRSKGGSRSAESSNKSLLNPVRGTKDAKEPKEPDKAKDGAPASLEQLEPPINPETGEPYFGVFAQFPWADSFSYPRAEHKLHMSLQIVSQLSARSRSRSAVNELKIGTGVPVDLVTHPAWPLKTEEMGAMAMERAAEIRRDLLLPEPG